MADAETLRNVPLFQDLPGKSIDRIAKFARRRVFQAGDAIVKEGDEGVGFFLVTKGTVDIARGGTSIAQVAEGGFFGEMALLDNHRRSATVTAIGDVETLAIMRSDFLAELRANGDLAVELLSVMSKRIRDLDQQLAER
jgi:CRP-like cAMP-binding protein